jgi:hypothetical protein
MEIPETLANGASIAVAFATPKGDDQSTLPLSVLFPTLPTAVTVDLQGAQRNVDNEFTKVQGVASVAGSVNAGGAFQQVSLQRGYFYRLLVSGLSGSGTIVAKIGG